MTDVALTLGDIVFDDFEIPDAIPFGGEQMTKIHRLTGGKRVVDTLGADDMALEWSGRFLSPDGLARARALDAMRKAGVAVTLSWSELSYLVVVKRFVANFETAWNLPYSISCEVVSDLSKPLSPDSGPSVDDMIDGDTSTLVKQGDEIGHSKLKSDIDAVRSAVSKVTTFVGQVRSTVNSVLAPIAQAQATVGQLIGDIHLINTSVGGILAGGDALTMASSLLSQVSAATTIGPLYQVQATLGRMQTNLNAVASAGQSIVQGGGDLYHMAVQAYGDVRAWTDIARANGLSDPILTGINKIQIPASPTGSGGVYSI